MKKLLSILLVLTMGPALIAGLQSCETCGDGDSLPIFFKLKDGTASSSFYKPDSIKYLPIRYTENDTITFNTPIKVEFIFNTERVALAEPSNSFNLTATLQACSIEFPYPRATQKILKADLVTKYAYGSQFKANDTINEYALVETGRYSYFGSGFKNLSDLKDKFATNEFKFAFISPQPNTEVTPFQMEAILTLSDGSVVRATSPKVYLGI
jgi:hypothetical protein